jgi:hypothetical protein
MKLFKEFVAFVKERHRIYERRNAGKPKPWTKDTILQSYRFCNVYREFDRVTIWIQANWRTPWRDDPNIWFAMIVARFVNWPDSLYELSSAVHNGSKINWSPRNFKLELESRAKLGEKVWSGAYMINAVGGEGRTKAAYIAERVLTPIWERRKEGQNAFIASHGCGLAEAHNWLSQFRGMGSFMAAQVVCDVKYTPSLAYARDWWTWAAPGPGSLRGMSRVEFGDLNTKYTDADWREALAMLQHKIDPIIEKAKMPRIHAQDLQNCLCEFDKYQRVLRGEGKPRSKFNGS